MTHRPYPSRSGSHRSPFPPPEHRGGHRSPPRPEPRANVGYLLAGGSMLVLMGALVDLRSVFQPANTIPKNEVCQTMVQETSLLSRQELSQLLTIPERGSKEVVRQVVSEPFCTLAPVEIRAGVQAEREAYPLEFDPQTWFVVLYEGNEYAGYSFVFQR